MIAILKVVVPAEAVAIVLIVSQLLPLRVAFTALAAAASVPPAETTPIA